MAIKIRAWLEHQDMSAAEKLYMKSQGVSFSPNYMIAHSYVEEVRELTRSSKAFGGRLDVDVLRFEAVSDKHSNVLQSSIHLNVFETMQEESQDENLREAVYNIEKQLFNGMRELEQNTPVLPTDEMIIRAQMRFMVDHYGIEAFARALKVFESERLR